MKKIILIATALCLLLVVTVGCNASPVGLTEAERLAQSTPSEYNLPLDVNILDGVSMKIQDVSPTGLVFFFENQTDNEYIYGSDFILYTLSNNTWERVEPIIENWAFTSEAYSIFPNATTAETSVDWQWLFGELPSGYYQFQKEILFVRRPGDFDRHLLAATFLIR